jgi:UDP-glucose 4-epimerase
MRNNKLQRIVITGGSGFIGNFLIDRLIKEGYKNIVVLDRHSKHRKGAKFIKCDVLGNGTAFKKNIERNDIVIHLACSTIPGTSETDPILDAEKNIAGTLRLLEACKDIKIKKILFPSSGGAIYGNHSRKRHRETDPTGPQSSYGVIKLAIEKYLAVYNHLYKLPYVGLRLSNLYGRRNLRNDQLGAVDVFLHRAIEGKPIIIWGDGEVVRDYVHIEDVLDFFVLAINQDSIQGIYNIGTGFGTSLNKIIKTINDLGVIVKPTYMPARGVDVRHNVLDINKAQKTGWRPRYPLAIGIRELYREIKKE